MAWRFPIWVAGESHVDPRTPARAALRARGRVMFPGTAIA